MDALYVAKNPTFFRWKTKSLIRLGVCADSFDYSLYAYSKTCLKWPLKKMFFQDPLLLNAGQKYCRMLPLTFIKLSFVIKIFVLSICEWPLKTGFTVCQLVHYV